MATLGKFSVSVNMLTLGLPPLPLSVLLFLRLTGQ